MEYHELSLKLYLYVICSGSITSVREEKRERVNLSATFSCNYVVSVR